MGNAEYGFVLWVNRQEVGFFNTPEEAQNAAKPHELNRAELQIRDSGASVSFAPTRIWNYRYDVNQWIEKMQG